MFIKNKYYKWYYNIIRNACQDHLNRVSGYYEKHHIIPRCLGGNDTAQNLVKLTAKEHFVCHRLLVYMTTGKDKSKMSYALLMFVRNTPQLNRTKITSKTYTTIKKLISEASSALHTGKIVSAESREKMSISKKITHNTPEFKHNASIRAKNRTAEHQAKIGLAHRGKTISSEMRAKQSAKLSGANNPRALSWLISFDSGAPDIQVTSLKTWCQQNNVSYGMIFRKSIKNQFYNGIRATKLSNQ